MCSQPLCIQSKLGHMFLWANLSLDYCIGGPIILQANAPVSLFISFLSPILAVVASRHKMELLSPAHYKNYCLLIEEMSDHQTC